MADFEIGVYNKKVRELVNAGQSHRDLADSWAEIHFIEIRAKDRSQALIRICSRYPENRGFVISEILDLG